MADETATVTETKTGINVSVSDAETKVEGEGEKKVETATGEAGGTGEREDVKKEEKKKEEEEAAAKPAETQKEEEEAAAKPAEEETKKEEETAKNTTITAEVRDAVLPVLREASEKSMGLASALRAATVTSENASALLPNAISKQIGDLRKSLIGILETYPLPVEKDENGVAKAAPAHQTLLTEKTDAISKIATDIAAGANSMDPKDMSALMSQMREIMWSMDTDMAVTSVSKSDKDKPASDEAMKAILKQAADLVISSEMRDAVVEKLDAFAETMLSAARKMKDAEMTTEKSDTPLPVEFGEAIFESLKALDDITKNYPSPASKSGAILGELQMCFDGIKRIVNDALGADMPVESDKSEGEEKETDAKEKEVAKSDDRLSKLEADVAKIAKAVVKEEDTGEEAGSVKAPNAAEDTGKTKVEKNRVSWSRDLAQDVAEEEAATKETEGK